MAQTEPEKTYEEIEVGGFSVAATLENILTRVKRLENAQKAAQRAASQAKGQEDPSK